MVDKRNVKALQDEVLGTVRALLLELGSGEAADRATLESSFDKDLGLGSLERVELLVRLEKRLGARLPESGVQAARTPGDWARIAASPNGDAPARGRWPIVQPSREAYPEPSEARSFTDVLRVQADRDPARVHIHLLDGDGGRDITHGDLLEASTRVAAGLSASGLRAGETVAIMLPTCKEFFASFLGVMLAGGIAVPVYPPTRPNQIETYVRRQALILRNAGVRFLISFDRVRPVTNVLAGEIPSLREVVSAPELAARGGSRPAPDTNPSNIFFVQYTSGSTGDPKGVTLTHSNVLANIRAIGFAVQARPSDAVVSWLPLYHDMGLIGSWLFSLYFGLPITVLSPLDFLVRPERWLWALSDSAGTLCPAPNFAFELCLRKVSEESMEGVDLSPWRVAINAGEPVLPSTLRRFASHFQRWGFDSRSFMPFYGLAESSVALTYPPFWRGPVIDRIDRAAFESRGRAERTEGGGDAEILEFVANGKPLPGHEIRIIGDGGEDLPDRERGRILFRGPSRTDGYFRNPEATAEVLDADGWLDSGDLGYAVEGEIYVTGRLKDCIIKGGRNIIPQDVEMAAWEVEGVRKGCVAAFGCVDESTGTERLVVVTETRTKGATEHRRIREQVIETVSEKIGIPPDEVVIAGPGFVPKTSSGKIQRLATRRLYERGAATARNGASPGIQLARIWARGAMRSAGRATIALGGRARANAVEALAGGMAATVGLVARLAPSPGTARHAISPCARAVARLSGGPAGEWPAVQAPCVMLVSRAGATDAMTVAGSIRGPFLFADRTAIRDLSPAQAFLLEPLVAPSGENGRGSRELPLLQRMESALAAGCSVVSFADNPAGQPPSRTRFRSEGFAAAAKAAVPLVPVLLRDGPRGTGRAIRCRPLSGTCGDEDLARSRAAVRARLEEQGE